MKRKRAKAKKKLAGGRAKQLRRKPRVGKPRKTRWEVDNARVDKLDLSKWGTQVLAAIDETRLAERLGEEPIIQKPRAPQVYMGVDLAYGPDKSVTYAPPKIVTDETMPKDRIEFRNSKDETVGVIENLAMPSQVSAESASGVGSPRIPEIWKWKGIIGKAYRETVWRPFADKPITHYDYDGLGWRV